MIPFFSRDRLSRRRYVEDLALWGMNSIVFPNGTNPHCPAEEIEQVMLPKQLKLMKAAKTYGIRVGLLTVANTLLSEPEAEIAASPVEDASPARRGDKGHRICPSNPKGLALLSKRYEQCLHDYAEVGLDFVISFPYDEGGCGCEQCRPWGANGYVRCCKVLSRLAKEKYPGCQFIAGTWCFDVLEKSEGEYEGFDRSIREDKTWCDASMVDSHFDFPQWPLDNGKPGAVPMYNFPEISMWGRMPWMGSGANPFPSRLATLWSQAKDHLDGGFPYSEGIGEDINKVICLGLYWDKEASAQDLVRRYCRAYCASVGDDGKSEKKLVDLVSQSIALMEEIYPTDNFCADKAMQISQWMNQANEMMSDDIRESWRWRILHLRSQIDMETAQNLGKDRVISEQQKDNYKELVALYCLENSPPSILIPRGI